MMRNPEETIGKIIDKASTSFIAYVDDNGYPITKAMLKPRERNGIKTIWFSTNTSSNKVKYFKKNSKARGCREIDSPMHGGCREIDSPMHGRRRYMCIVASIKINDKIEKRWLTTTIFSPLHVIM